jgi:hypothetical protein
MLVLEGSIWTGQSFALSDSIACTIPVTLFFGEAKVREWDQCCLLRVFKHCFLNHVVSCHCFGISVVEIEN